MAAIFSKLLRALRYLLLPGNVLYWGLHALASVVYDWYRFRQAQALFALIAERSPQMSPDEAATIAFLAGLQDQIPDIPPYVIWFFFVSLLLMIAKMCDGIMRIGEGLEEEGVPLAPVSVIPFFMVFKYLFGMFLWAIPWLFVIFQAKFAAWSLFVMIGFFWFFAPAMIMNLIGNNSLGSMLSPMSWFATIANLGWRYLAVVLIPALFALVFGAAGGWLASLIGEVPALVLEGVAVTFCIALTWIYCGYFMRADEVEAVWDEAALAVLAEMDTSVIPEEEQRVFVQDMLAVDSLIEEGAGGIEEILAPYLQRDPAVWFPAFRRQHLYLQKRGGRDALRHLEERMLARAAGGEAGNGEKRLYAHLHDALVRIGDHDPERLQGDWIHPLARLANAQGDHEMVLRLTRQFAQRHPGHKDTVGNYYLAARALDRLGRREEAVRLLTQILARYPEHPRAAQMRRTLEMLQSPSR